MNHPSGYAGSDPCGLGLTLCSVLTHSNGTVLLWDDMRRTLAFVWELHVFGSAGLFVLLAGTCMLGLAGSLTLVQPVCHALTQANSLLLLVGALRAVFLLLDPYGTRQILSRPALAALHNSPLQLLLWAQAALTPVALRGTKLVLLPVKLQRHMLVGGLAAFHCTLLLIADLLSPTLSPYLPLLLQTLSLCWGLPLCMGILIQSLSRPHSCITTSITPRFEKRAKRVTAVCAMLGILCCCLQIHSLLWIYGVLGNWRRFGWGWWLSQSWARVLELSWGFSLTVLGSCVTRTPRQRHHSQRRDGRWSRGQRGGTVWDEVLRKMRTRSIGTSEKNLEDLMPNEWTRQQLPRTIFNSAMCNTIPVQDIHCPGSSCDPEGGRPWQTMGEQDCVLSPVEIDTWPLSPINLRRSIDNALHHGNCTVACLFTSPPRPRTHDVGVGDKLAYTSMDMSPTHIGYMWTPNSESTPALAHHFQENESVQTSDDITNQTSDEITSQTSDYITNQTSDDITNQTSDNITNQTSVHSSNTRDDGQQTVNDSDISTILHLEDWPVNDITDL